MAARPVFDDRAHDRGRYARARRRFAFRARTPAAARAWQTAFRRELRRALGLPVLEREYAAVRPKARCVSTERLDGYRRERWYLWTEPEVPLPFWRLVPEGTRGPRPLVLTPHGHNPPDVYVGITRTEAEKRSMAGGERDIAVQAVREGHIAIAPTTRGFGEVRTRVDRRRDALHSCRRELMHALLTGRTPIGQRVWDIGRLLDWALARGDIRPGRIAITGNSGGGTTSLFSAACDTRISVAVPSCYFCTFTGSIGSIFHCDCNYVPGLLQLGEMADVAGLIAPRPFRAIAGKRDEIFPIAETRKAYRALRRVYRVFGAADRCSLYVGSAGHRYYSEGVWPFARRWL